MIKTSFTRPNRTPDISDRIQVKHQPKQLIIHGRFSSGSDSSLWEHSCNLLGQTLNTLMFSSSL